MSAPSDQSPAPLAQLASDAQRIFHAAVEGVSPARLMQRRPLAGLLPQPLQSYGRVVVLAMGKAALVMTHALLTELGDKADTAVAVVPHGYPGQIRLSWPPQPKVEIIESSHPVPDAAGQRAAARLLEVAGQCGPQDLVIALISGGGSALCPAFAPGIGLEEARQTFGLLLRSGANIEQVNTVRKHISAISGGRLAQAAAPATIVSLVLSDVLGDDLPTIASGPTVADPTTFADTRAILDAFGLWDQIPAPVRAHLERGLADPALETPKPGDPQLERCRTVLIGGLNNALEAARAKAEQMGYQARIVNPALEGEAREVGTQLAQLALEQAPEARSLSRPQCLIWGGETTVTVRGNGIGGRNQELALSAALTLAGSPEPVVLLSGGSDGVDGPPPPGHPAPAGAWVTPQTVPAATGHQGPHAQSYLDNNDSGSFFRQAGGLIITGPTHTNVTDIQLALIGV